MRLSIGTKSVHHISEWSQLGGVQPDDRMPFTAVAAEGPFSVQYAKQTTSGKCRNLVQARWRLSQS
jgi:hypothetical protein